MLNSLYDKRHIMEYLQYGTIAGLLYIIPAWIYFLLSDYNSTYIIFSGSILFMFVILFYVWKLANRRTEYKSTWMMIIAAHGAIVVGIIISVLLTLALCFTYIPGFLSGNSPTIIEDAPSVSGLHNTGTTMILFVCATVENFGVAGVIGILGPYVFKKNQTTDKTALLEKHI